MPVQSYNKGNTARQVLPTKSGRHVGSPFPETTGSGRIPLAGRLGSPVPFIGASFVGGEGTLKSIALIYTARTIRHFNSERSARQCTHADFLMRSAGVKTTLFSSLWISSPQP